MFGHAVLPGLGRIVKELRRITNVIVLDETCTSLNCRVCVFKDPNVATRHVVQRGKVWKAGEGKNTAHGGTVLAGYSSIHDVYYCPNCNITWDRDVNAAFNILFVYLWMRDNAWVRPPAFDHDPNLPLPPYAPLSACRGW
jgi:transposase